MKELTEEQLIKIDHSFIFHSDNSLYRLLEELKINKNKYFELIKEDDFNNDKNTSK
jgi:hypothetical protein